MSDRSPVRADDYPVGLRFSVPRKLFEVLERRAKRKGLSVESEAKNLLEWALLLLVDPATRERLYRSYQVSESPQVAELHALIAKVKTREGGPQ